MNKFEKQCGVVGKIILLAGLVFLFPVLLPAADYFQIHHPLEDQVPPPRDPGRFSQRIIAGRGFRHSGQHGAFGVAQRLGVFVEIEAGGLDDAPGAVPEVDLVEIHLQDLLL